MTDQHTSDLISTASAARLLGYARCVNARRLAEKIDHDCFARKLRFRWVFSRSACLVVAECKSRSGKKRLSSKHLRTVRAALNRKQRNGDLVTINKPAARPARAQKQRVYQVTFTALTDAVRRQETQIAELQAQLTAHAEKPRAWWRLW